MAGALGCSERLAPGFAVDYLAGTFTGSFSDFDAEVSDGVLKGSAKVASVQVL